MSEARASTCPICQRAVAREVPSFPFCTSRCKLIDLGNWIEGRYVIPGNHAEDGPLVEGDIEVPERGETPQA